MEWIDDPAVMETLDNYMIAQEKPLKKFLDEVMPYADQTPIWAIVILWGKFSKAYVEFRKTDTETEAWAKAVAAVAHEPLAQELVGSVVGMMGNKAVGLDE